MRLSRIAESIRPSSTLSISARAQALKSEGVDVINFAAGEPDFDTPDNIKQAAVEAIESNFTRYTRYEGISELRQAVADYLKVHNNVDYTAEGIVISNGSKQAVKNALAALIDPEDEVIIPAPYWNSYIDIVKMLYGVPVVINTRVQDSFKLTAAALEKAITPKTRVLILNTPNNPTGMVYSRQELEAICEVLKGKDIFVISDELYSTLIYSRKLKHTSIASLGEEIKEKTVVVGGLSKSYAMTGWRVGYTACGEELAKAIGAIQSHSTSNVNSIAQKAAFEALTGPQDAVEAMLHDFEHRRDYIAQRISDIPMISSLLPKGAFYLFVDVSKLLGKEVIGNMMNTSEDIAKILMDRYRVAVVPSDVFGISGFIRISFAASMRDIVEGVNRIESFVKDNY